jgi:hypothetical protein
MELIGLTKAQKAQEKKQVYPWTPAMKRLKRLAKKEGWLHITYYDNGYRWAYLKSQGRKWSQIVIVDYKKKKVGEEVDELTKKMKPVYKGVYTPVTKKILNTKLLTKG